MNDSAVCFDKERDLLTRSVADETFIIPAKGRVADLEALCCLNETAAFIWQIIDGRTSVRQIVDAVVNEYDSKDAEAERDVSSFLESLATEGLIRLNRGEVTTPRANAARSRSFWEPGSPGNRSR